MGPKVAAFHVVNNIFLGPSFELHDGDLEAAEQIAMFLVQRGDSFVSVPLSG